MLTTRPRPALLPFMTAGLPTPAASPSLFAAMADAGADGFEVGLPYSDPLMDGPVIMQASAAALAAGTTRRRALEIVGMVASLGRPTLAMTYANPVMQTGWQEFCRQLADQGADGVIVPDLPLDESGPLREAAAEAGIGVVLFVSPTTEVERVRQVAAAEPAFIYGIADMGVTGERRNVSDHVASLSARVRAVTKVPLVLGVGISTPDHVRRLTPYADGLIVGTALVRRVLEAGDVIRAAESLHLAVKELRAALN